MNAQKTGLSSNISFLKTQLLEWGNQNYRDMPWRNSASPYEFAIAEILLQKTRGEDVVEVWENLINCYPTSTALAAADCETVATLVACLGLRNQRSWRLISMARHLSTNSPLKWANQRIPGLGSYGRSMLLLATGLEPDTPPVDGNIARIVCRYFGLSFRSGEPRKKPMVRDLVDGIIGAGSGIGEKLKTVYALVDFGSIVCSPKVPRCELCPLAAECSWGFARREEDK